MAWRVRVRLELAPTWFSGFVVTDGTGAERLDRFTPTPDAIMLADRCHARHGGLAAVGSQAADLIVRYGLSSSALQDPTGARVTLNGVLGRSDLPDRPDLPVRLPGPDGSWHPGRLLLVAPNIVSAEREMGVDPRDFRLWVCIHEETHRVQFGAVPWLREHLMSELHAFLDVSDLDAAAMLRRPPRWLRSL